MTEQAGRDPQAMAVETLTGVGAGTPDEWRAKIEQLASIGINQVCLTSGRGAGRTPQQHLDTLLAGYEAIRDLAD